MHSAVGLRTRKKRKQQREQKYRRENGKYAAVTLLRVTNITHSHLCKGKGSKETFKTHCYY
jgi:hypothetical protein